MDAKFISWSCLIFFLGVSLIAYASYLDQEFKNDILMIDTFNSMESLTIESTFSLTTEKDCLEVQEFNNERLQNPPLIEISCISLDDLRNGKITLSLIKVY